jgi:hypothetical protein
MLREYWDTQVWSNGAPLENARTTTGYFDRYDAFELSASSATMPSSEPTGS